ncbi:MAG TPA: hypothetical protein VHY20_10635 [Pirellulales bacterium]|jgi:hypothetical protein|nr:hypothetical protein [Pirellulales bacterium]
MMARSGGYRPPPTAAQQRQVAVLHGQGLHRYEIARRTGLHHQTVTKLLAAMDLTPHAGRIGRPGISPRIKKRAVDLHLRYGQGPAQIGRTLDLPRGTVHAILHGVVDKEHPALAAHVDGDEPQVLGRGERLLAEPVRCGCGALLRVVPCRRCTAAREQAKLGGFSSMLGQPAPSDGDAAGPPAIELDGDARARYLELRGRRL